MDLTSKQPLATLTAFLLAAALACGTSPADPTTQTGTSVDSETPGTSGAATSTGQLTTSETATSTSGATVDPTSGGVHSETGTADTSSGGRDSTGTGDSSTGTSSGGPGTSTTGSDTTTDTTTGTSGTTGDAEGLGMLSGECGLIDAMELESPAPFVFANAIDLGLGGFEEQLLTPGGMQMIAEGGLNDGSLKSEVIAYEVLARCDMASLLKTEGKIVYQDPMGKKTDLLVELDGLKVGVSVVRALGFPKEDPYTVAQATTILKKKLGDIQISSANVAPEDAWVKQILSVVAYGPMHVDSVLTAYAGLDAQLKADTILVVTVTDGDDSLLY
jgi:hypothetical protein